MSESRDWIRGQLAGGAVAPSSEESRYAEGAPGAESEVDYQDEEQAADPTVELPATWPRDFVAALTDEAARDLEAGADLSAEWGAWVRGEVGTGPAVADLPPEAPAELPPSADEAAEYGQQWLQLARDGGSDEVGAGEAFEQARAWQDIARSAAIAEAQIGRRQSWDLSPEDERDVLQDEIDRRVQAGRERWGADR